MIRPATVLLIVSLGLLPACRDVGDLGDLDDAKRNAVEGDLLSNAEREIDCDVSTPACAQTALAKADACLRIAQDEVKSARASSVETRAKVDCALTAYGQALPTLPDARGTIASSEAEALRLSRVVATTPAEAERQNSRLLARAMRLSERQPMLESGYYYAADARLAAAVTGTDDACSALEEARSLAAQAAGARQVPDLSRLPVDALLVRIDRASSLAECA